MKREWYRWQVGVLCVAAVAVWLFAVKGRLTHEAEQALKNSDRAFNEGRLRVSLDAAHRASVAATPGSALVRRATARLRAIAVGSEATGRHRIALLAWSALAVTSFNTPSGAASAMMRREATQHVETLLPRRSDTHEADAYTKTGLVGVAVTPPSLPIARAVCMLVALSLLACLVPGVGSSRYWQARSALVRLTGLMVIGLTAALSWCIAWVAV